MIAQVFLPSLFRVYQGRPILGVTPLAIFVNCVNLFCFGAFSYFGTLFINCAYSHRARKYKTLELLDRMTQKPGVKLGYIIFDSCKLNFDWDQDHDGGSGDDGKGKGGDGKSDGKEAKAMQVGPVAAKYVNRNVVNGSKSSVVPAERTQSEDSGGPVVGEARDETPYQTKLTKEELNEYFFVDLKIAENALAWSEARRVIRSFNERFSRRIDAFLSIYMAFCVMCVGGVNCFYYFPVAFQHTYVSSARQELNPSHKEERHTHRNLVYSRLSLRFSSHARRQGRLDSHGYWDDFLALHVP